ncbi:uncharacterized protein LOC135823606 [Sycon ciliatum]|uniref:uncharacterized protein LOC135823606 n=1 Tax=Sycon ciliatum TaxID=27933 RepID=UPI0031F6B93D
MRAGLTWNLQLEGANDLTLGEFPCRTPLSPCDSSFLERGSMFKNKHVPRRSPPKPAPPIRKVFQSVAGPIRYLELPKMCLGVGSFGKVIQAVTEGTNHPVAIKTSFSKIDEGTLHEFDILNGIGRHPNIIQLVDLVVELTSHSSETHLVVNKCHGALWSWLGRCRQPVPANVRTEITRQVYSGLAFIHSKGWVHNDLHSANILVSGYNGQVSITDFGMSLRFTGDDGVNIVSQHRDLRSVTLQVILEMWLGRGTKYVKMVRDCAVVMHNHGVNSELIGMAQHWLIYRAGEVFRSDNNRNIGCEYRTALGECPDLQRAILLIHSYALTHDILNRGMAVPQDLHRLFRYGILAGPDHKLSATYISTQLDNSLSEGYRQQAQSDICSMTVEMESTTV